MVGQPGAGLPEWLLPGYELDHAAAVEQVGRRERSPQAGEARLVGDNMAHEHVPLVGGSELVGSADALDPGTYYKGGS